VLLVAVIRSGTDVALTAGTLEHLSMNSPNVAVRSLRIEGFSVAQGSSTSPFSTRLYPDAGDATAPKLVPARCRTHAWPRRCRPCAARCPRPTRPGSTRSR